MSLIIDINRGLAFGSFKAFSNLYPDNKETHIVTFSQSINLVILYILI